MTARPTLGVTSVEGETCSWVRLGTRVQRANIYKLIYLINMYYYQSHTQLRMGVRGRQVKLTTELGDCGRDRNLVHSPRPFHVTETMRSSLPKDT